MASSTSAWLDGPSNTSFHTRTWSPPAGTDTVASVLFVHGFVEHIDRYIGVFDRWAQRGILVFSYDQRGFGQTAHKTSTQGVTNWSQSFLDISHFLAHARSLTPAASVPLYLFGHSMGGALSLAFCTRSPATKGVDELSGVIVSSPLLRQAEGVKAPKLLVKAGSVLGAISGKLTLKAEVRPADISRDEEVQKAYVNDPYCKPVGTFKGVADMLLGGESLMTEGYKRWPERLPLLIVHGSADKVTDHSASQRFVDLVKADGKPAEFQSFDGYYHEMHNEPGDLKWVPVDAMSDWILKHTVPKSKI